MRRGEIVRGQVIATSGTVTPHARFEADLYVLQTREGGRAKPFFSGYRPQFFVRTTDVSGTVLLTSGEEMVMPGDSVRVTVELGKPIAVETGLGFAVREGGRTVAAGAVTRLVD
jgi:elongation factor Tu